ncbi:MAG: shikimate kinase [Roseivirga sp.]|jgi:shikimate kinase
MKIVLLGYMASGKSVVGKVLAKQLNYEFIDLDAYIELNEKKTVSAIFYQKSEIYFRRKETEYLKEIFSEKENFILSLGGGTPCYGLNMEIVLKNSQSFYLKTSLNTLHSRLLKEKLNRPLVAYIEPLKLKEFIAKHIFERTAFYDKANHIVSTDEQTIQQVVDSINTYLI